MTSPTSWGTRWFLPSTPAAVGTARERAVASLRLWGIYLDADCEDSIRLLVSELVTNAVLHDPGPLVTVGLYASVTEQSVVIEVLDGNRKQPAVRHVGDQAEGGRGMLLVDALTAGRWGAAPTGKGKRVWGELPLPDQPRAARRRQLLHSMVRAARPGDDRQIGPRRLWDTVEQLAAAFPDEAPSRDDFGLTITSQEQRVWYRELDGSSWLLPPG